MNKAVKRGIRRVWDVTLQRHSAKHTAGPVLPPGNWAEFDPFLMMMEDKFERGVFDFHPHRGMETVTFVLEGTLEHLDNKGNSGLLKPGDLQWMTAGRGIIHSEQPVPGDTVHSLQLWINLPSAKKMVETRYQDLHAEDMPVLREEGALIRVFSGSSNGVAANTLNHVPVTIVEIILEPGASMTQDLPSSYNGFIYVVNGEGYFGAEETKGKKQQVLWLGSASEGSESEVTIRAQQKLHAFLVAGEPIGEPVVQHGPFVMNTIEEIKQAFDDYNSGNFGK
ncbi:pirin family protein [Paenibacillus sediminis]|uniref:Redox-sensitive bicupin YhaK (Pirin superfamily) n=1 Tax=Paenibacillus sediminis TaxID=664909 RepID=A0ABS4H4K5_9BACL|nr:pirin family protein [Paenibacillus sediminis]MBP1937015.1 redox-sensitive bicupin YhaK (pirin superfamily) [Paenibacillus sediminis]